MGPTRIADRLRAEIDQFLDSAPGGMRLPTDRQFAERFGMSVSTVRRVLRSYVECDLIERIGGKGTFVKRETEANPPEISSPHASSEAVVNTILEMIRNGRLRVRDALPPMKFMVLQYKLAPRTVRRAYEKLVEMGMVSRMGKTFWVGDSDGLFSLGRRKRVILYKAGVPDFSSVFREDLTALAYQKMERELIRYGFVLHFETLDNFSPSLRKWREEGGLPDGLIFYGANEREHLTALNALSRFLRASGMEYLPVVVDWSWGDYHKIPSGVLVLSRGHIQTSLARTAAKYAIEYRYPGLCFFLHDPNNSILWATALKIRAELKWRNPEIPFRIISSRPNWGRTEKEFLTALHERLEEFGTVANLRKYRHTSFTVLEKEITLTGNFTTRFPRLADMGLWLFSCDEYAATALDWAKRSRIAVPSHLAVLGMESDPEYYHMGISRLEVDLDRLGYLMAHSIIRDFQPAKSHKGFLQCRSDVIRKSTSR